MKGCLCSLVALGLLVGLAGDAKAQPTYVFTPLDVPGSSAPSNTIANGMNASGQIVGVYDRYNHAFLFDQGNYTKLDVPGSNYTVATGINASGQIVGYYGDG